MEKKPLATFLGIFEQKLDKLKKSIKEEIQKPKRDRSKAALKELVQQAKEMRDHVRSIKNANESFCPHCGGEL
jgi:uncharacterized membrane protein (DUF106 family)